ncbi:hypothetical protein PG997_010546 [Apiospora hydei]|uniref:Uncharacterized protein n=1 Tax=Apiospora hydei TaxID=1337664 RepID=A0ABR1VXA7_9PEZI
MIRPTQGSRQVSQEGTELNNDDLQHTSGGLMNGKLTCQVSAEHWRGQSPFKQSTTRLGRDELIRLRMPVALRHGGANLVPEVGVANAALDKEVVKGLADALAEHKLLVNPKDMLPRGDLVVQEARVVEDGGFVGFLGWRHAVSKQVYHPALHSL